MGCKLEGERVNRGMMGNEEGSTVGYLGGKFLMNYFLVKMTRWASKLYSWVKCS